MITSPFLHHSRGHDTTFPRPGAPPTVFRVGLLQPAQIVLTVPDLDPPFV